MCVHEDEERETQTRKKNRWAAVKGRGQCSSGAKPALMEEVNLVQGPRVQPLPLTKRLTCVSTSLYTASPLDKQACVLTSLAPWPQGWWFLGALPAELKNLGRGTIIRPELGQERQRWERV